MVAIRAFRNLIETACACEKEARLLPDEESLFSMSVEQISELLKSPDRLSPHLLIRLAIDPRAQVRRLGYTSLRMRDDLPGNERLFSNEENRYIAGVDEAGRGAIAGPLVAAAVMFNPETVIPGVSDSKKLTPESRETLYSEIIHKAASVSVSFIDSSIIDHHGIRYANGRAFLEALQGIDDRCSCAISDHFPVEGTPFPTFGIPKADESFHSVAAASIVAKVERDRVMRSLHSIYPSYGFESNKGYGTSAHKAAIARIGPCAVHRRSFAGVSIQDEPTLWGP